MYGSEAPTWRPQWALEAFWNFEIPQDLCEGYGYPPLTELHTPDAVVVNVAGRRVLGREAFHEAMEAALASPLSDVRTTLEVLDIRLPAPDVAVVSCVKTVHDGRAVVDRSTALPTTGALTYVMVRSAGAWRVALAQTTPTLG